MHFFEINLFGVYVAPIAIIIVAAWIVLLPVRRIANRFGLLRHVWHPALFEFAVYLIVLSAIVLAIAHRENWIPLVDRWLTAQP
jgi:protein AaeX